MLGEPAVVSSAVTFGYLAGQKTIQAHHPGQHPRVEHGACSYTALIKNVLNMKVTKVQMDNMEFLFGTLNNLESFLMVLQHCCAKAEKPVMS